MGRDYKGRRDRRNIDKWFCGSYRDYIPDHYELGYQICSYAYARYDENVWDRVAWFGSRNPYMLATTRIALEKYYGTNVRELFRETFDALERHWDSLPRTGDSAVPLVPMPEGNYTTYQWPLPLSDTTVLVLKTDYDRPSRFVRARHPYRCRGAGVLYGPGFDPPRDVRRARMVDGVPPFEALRAAGQLAALLHGSGAGDGTYLRRAAQCALSDAGTRGTGLGRV